MPLKTDKAGNRAVPRAHRGESRQGIPGRVALQQSPLALHRSRLIFIQRSVDGKNFFRTGAIEA